MREMPHIPDEKIDSADTDGTAEKETSLKASALAQPQHMELLVSSMSAHGIAVTVGRKVVSCLREGGWDVSVRVTTPDEDPEEVAAASQAPLLGALGGDGYLSAVACGVHRSGALFVPFPGGRGNDLCRALGIGTDAVARARSLLKGFTEQELDGIRITDPHGNSRIVLGIVSFGFDALANRIANDTSWLRRGSLTYAYGALSALRTHRPTPLLATVDGVEEDLGGWLTSVSNSGWFGGGINLVPSSRIGDGQIELVHIGPLPMRQAIRVLAQVLVTRGENPAMTVRSVREITVHTPEGVIAMADGDYVGETPLTMTAEPHVARVLV
ncbi:diacylglycerol/lipid kinase family protein [Schaalia sp. lx-100]|uniref:diacylglycerol/lipid kinase family protein n=1 Tax=Schaalia sp. lx-100 TaxID=2899081 RepID=UPI001E5F03A7|nr:diacylglycerol kinase family protein [Schaalia sp. lx-100]MCD4556669.1 diacylglycerol kinase [Schaalia sp. lx-100]